MQNQASLQETKQHGAVRFPFNLYPCTIPGDFPQVALHWQESMELVFVKRGAGLVQVGAVSCPAYQGDIFIFTPGTKSSVAAVKQAYLRAHSPSSPAAMRTPCSRLGRMYSRFSCTALGLPGRLTMSVLPRRTLAARLSIPRGVMLRL